MVEQIQSSFEKKQMALGDEIQKAEESLGLKTENDKLVEASLFIDKKFLSYALITGVVQKPEFVFGEKAWADYLYGRLYAREYRNKDLTIDFIINLHKQLTKRFNPEISGKIRKVGVIGASYDDGQPVTYTSEQVKAIEENSQLKFERVPSEDLGSTTGFIIYPHVKAGIKTEELVEKDLEEICEWYNSEKKNGSYNPDHLAGKLKRKLISLHIFEDGNGRLTEVLKSWSLENDGLTSSMIDEPGDDILTDEETWIANISKGRQKYADVKQRQHALEEAGIENVNALFDLGQDKAFYEYIFKYLNQAPPLPTNGDKHKHQVYEDFLTGFKEEMNNFQEYMRSTSKVNTTNGEREITQGGLITPEFMQYALSSALNILPLEIRKQFFTDTEVYRGGMIDDKIDDQKLCQMFQSYTAVGTGYRPLERSYSPATSLRKISPEAIRESMEYYNKMFASSYFQKKHPEIENPYVSMVPPVRDLNRTVGEHTAGGDSIWNSPFVSTSLDYKESRSWATKFYAGYARNAHHGVLFKVQLPREGMVMTFGKKFEGLKASGITHEYEALVAGGLQPASISGIEVYDRTSVHSNPGLVAKKIEKEGKVNVVIEDRHGEFVVNRTYAYQVDTAGFMFESEEVTDIPSSRPIEQPVMTYPYSQEKDLHSWIGGHEKEYISPFDIKSKTEKGISDIYHSSLIEKKFSSESISFVKKYGLIESLDENKPDINNSNINKYYSKMHSPIIKEFPKINNVKEKIEGSIFYPKIGHGLHDIYKPIKENNPTDFEGLNLISSEFENSFKKKPKKKW